MNSTALFARISASCSIGALIISFSELNFFRRALAFAGPMFGKPSRMNWSCSFFDLNIFEGRRAREVFSGFFVRTEM